MRAKQGIYFGKKIVVFLVSVFILSVVTFYVSRLAPGDPLVSYYGDRVEKMSPEEREWAEERNISWWQNVWVEASFMFYESIWHRIFWLRLCLWSL